MKRFAFSFLALATSVGLFALFLFAHLSIAPRPSSFLPAEVRVEQGEPLSAVVRKLRDSRVISNERLFSLWARMTGAEKKIHWGLYRFDIPLSPREVLDRMVLGKGIFQVITVPEGYTVNDIADLLAQLHIAEKQKFLDATEDPQLLASLGLQNKGIEGYLFPSTYHFTPGTPEKDIVLAMAEQFRKVFQPLLERRDPNDPLTPHEIVTLASIVEKETGVESERPLVSAVFHNRLKLHMPLQSDPTVIYGLNEFDGNLTRKNLQDPSPYNTYRIAALPPGPICNPSLSSIKAALNPADAPYLYFVSKNDGTHLFSERLEDHNRAVKMYQPVSRSTVRRG
ncbi:MAG TPA: endolytic transglycosylase MltG [Candidatus Binatia bacterium]